MDTNDAAQRLHDEILEKVREYYRLVHAPSHEAAFTPGTDAVRYAGRVFDERELCQLVDSSLEFWLTYGRYSRSFERRLGEYLGVRFALLVNSGSSANLLAFMTLTSPQLGDRRVRRGDEVITVAAGFPTTVAPIVQYGAVPVFVDVEPDTANVDVTQLESAISSKTRAVILAHTLGNPFQLHAVTSFCKKYGLWLIEDNCDAFGSRYDGRLTGTWGDLGTSSFYPPHHMTMGEGGAVYTNNPQLKKIALSMRDWGRDCWCESGVDNTCGCRFTGQFGSLPEGYDHKYVYSHFGYNLKVSDMQAAVGCAQLDKMPSFVEKRKANFERLYEGLKDLPELRLFAKYPASDPSWFGFLITLTESAKFSRNAIVEYLECRRIQTRNLFAGNIVRHPCFESLVAGVDYRVIGDLRHTDQIMNRAFWIGLYPGMNRVKLDYMVTTVREFCQNAVR